MVSQLGHKVNLFNFYFLFLQLFNWDSPALVFICDVYLHRRLCKGRVLLGRARYSVCAAGHQVTLPNTAGDHWNQAQGLEWFHSRVVFIAAQALMFAQFCLISCRLLILL